MFSLLLLLFLFFFVPTVFDLLYILYIYIYFTLFAHFLKNVWMDWYHAKPCQRMNKWKKTILSIVSIIFIFCKYILYYGFYFYIILYIIYEYRIQWDLKLHTAFKINIRLHALVLHLLGVKYISVQKHLICIFIYTNPTIGIGIYIQIFNSIEKKFALFYYFICSQFSFVPSVCLIFPLMAKIL